MKRKKKNGRGKNPIEKISGVLDFPPILSGNSAHIELMDNKEAIVDGVSGVILYDETIIRLSIGKKEVKFLGEGLELRTFGPQEAVIVGEILSVEFE